MAPRRTLFALSLAATLCAIATPRDAHARTVVETRYGFDVAWNAAIRMVRVDLGFTIVERDRETGFLLFNYRDATNHTSPGSLELVPATVDGTPGVRVIVQLSQMPSYLERMMLNQLDRKLHAEYGEPAAPNTRREPAPPGIGTAPREENRDRAREENRDRPREENRAPAPEAERNRASDEGRSRIIVRPRETEAPRNANGE